MKQHVLIAILLLTIASVSAASFEFNGSVYDNFGTALEDVNVTIQVYNYTEDPVIVGTHATQTNASGGFNLTIADYGTTDVTFITSVVKDNGTTIYVGKPVPGFPEEMMNQLSPIDFYIKPGFKVNLTAVNSTGGVHPFYYQVKDTALGFPIAEEFSSLINQSTFYLQSGRNYSTMIIPDKRMPRSTNISGQPSHQTLDLQFNTSESFVWVSGYATYQGEANFTDFHIIPYLLEPGVKVFPARSGMPLNMSSWRPGSPVGDEFEAFTGFYNMTLLGVPGTGIDLLMFVFANTSDNNAVGFWQNITLTYGQSDVELNITLFDMAGYTNINRSQEDPSVGTVQWSTNEVNFTLQNGSGVPLSDTAFVELEVDLTDLGGMLFSFVAELEAENAGSFTLPLILNESVDMDLEIFTNDAPLEEDILYDDLNALMDASDGLQFNISAFNPGAIDGGLSSGEIFIDMIKSTDACNVPSYNRTACSLLPSGEVSFDSFNPLSVVVGASDLTFIMGVNDTRVQVMYVNADLLASGPPDALFDDDTNGTDNGSVVSEAWRFGSSGPEIYDRILLGMPYNTSLRANTVKGYLKNLYDEDFNVVWNISNGTGNLPDDYEDFDTQLFNTSATCSTTDSNLSQGVCYLDQSNGLIWLAIAHFSGVGPTIEGEPQTVATGLGNITSDRGTYSCYPDCLAYVNVSSNRTDLNGSQTIFVNNTAEDSGVTWRIEYYNYSDGTWNTAATENDTTITDFNWSYHTVAQNQFRMNITLPSALSTKWNWSIFINGSTYTLDPYLDSIALSTADGFSTIDTTPDFSFALYSDNASVQTCSLYINGTQNATNSSTNSAVTTTLTANTLAVGHYSWLASCNVTGNSIVRSFDIIADSVPPAYSSAGSSSSNPSVGDTIYLSANWTDAYLDLGNLAVSLFRNGTLLSTNTSADGTAGGGSLVNFSYTFVSAEEGAVYNFTINATDNAGNTNQTGAITVTVASAAPNVTFISPTSTAYASQPNVSFAVYDGVSGIDNTRVNITINGTVYAYSDGDLTGVLATNSTTNTTLSVVPSSALPSGTINVSVIAYDAAGFSTSTHYTFTVDLIAPTTAPNITGVSTDSGSGNLNVSWEADAQASSYGVFYSSSVLNNSILNGTRLGNTTHLHFYHNSTSNGTAYWYWVTSIDSAGRENATVGNITAGLNTATATDTVAPTVPTNVNRSVSSNTATIRWQSVLTDVNGDPDSTGLTYRVWYKTNTLNQSRNASNASMTSHAYVSHPTTSTTFSIPSSCTSACRYLFAVTTIDDGNNSNETLINTSLNVLNTTLTYTATTDDSGSSGGSSSGGSSSSFIPSGITTSSNIVAKVSRGWVEFKLGDRYEMPITNNDIALTAINVLAQQRASGPSVEVIRISDSDTAPPLTTPVHQYLLITGRGIGEEDIDATISFSVPRGWLNSEGVLPDNVVLRRYSNGWEDLETRYLEDQDGDALFEADTPGFSVFAITTRATATEESVDTSDSQPEPPVVDSVEPEDLETEEEEDVAEEEGGSVFPIIFWTFLSLVVIGGVVAYIIYAKKQR